jgi:CRP/FNR family cyclic AMP-dependent transcriptional regulator
MRKVLYIFGFLSDLDIEWLARVGTRKKLGNGEVIIQEGELVETLAIVLEGELLVSTRSAGQIARLGVGEIVGEMSLVDSAAASATVAALGSTFVLLLDKTTLFEKLDVDIGFSSRFYRALAIFLADRLRSTLHLPELLSGSDKTPSRDELDPAILDNVWAAGERFNRMLAILRGRGDSVGPFFSSPRASHPR